MNRASAPLRRSLITIAPFLALCAVLLASQAQAQGSVSITVFEENYAVQSINNPATVDYTPNIEVTPANAELECTPPSGSQFPRGATLVTCTATLGSATDTASFYVLVANGDDTDVDLFAITQNPSPAIPSGIVTYTIEVRTNVGRAAREVVVTGTIPAQLIIQTVDNDCNVSQATITCTTTALQQGLPRGFQVTAQIRPGFQGGFTFPWALTLGDGQFDLRANNNSRTATTQVQPSQAPNKIYIPLIRR